MKTSEFLKEVKALRACNRYYRGNGLCISCWELEGVSVEHRGAAGVAVGRIEELLQGHFYLRWWLIYHRHAQPDDFYTKAGKAKLARTRDAWLDWLIADFAAKGD